MGSSDRTRLSFLAESGEQEIIDDETATKLDLARTEPGGDIPWNKSDVAAGCNPSRSFRPAAGA